MPDDTPSRPTERGFGWGFGIFAAVILLIIVSWAFGGHGRGWGRQNGLAHMMPPAVGADNGPATRSNAANGANAALTARRRLQALSRWRLARELFFFQLAEIVAPISIVVAPKFGQIIPGENSS
jgi:hypothetical protein